jgi:RHS repeat-associated protein
MVTDPDSNITTYTYDNIGNRETTTYPNNTQANYVYDPLNRLIYLENRDLALNSVISSYTYDLGPAGNRLAVTEHSGRRVEYAYDDLYRLVRESIYDDGVTLADDISYTYDAVGNRLTKTDYNGTINYSYDANDRLLSAGGTAFTYDNNGNTLSKTDANGMVSYAYDFENRLTEINDPAAGLTTYTYDPDGNRLSKTDSTGTIRYLVDINRTYAQVLQESLPGGSVVTYTHGDDLVSQNHSGNLNFYHYDGNMSTRQLTDATGLITDTYTYDAFGNPLASTGSTPNNYLYTGEQYDPNAGFYYLRARYYNPEIGRLVTRDTYIGSCWEPQTLHKYVYAHNNPISNVDPSGHAALYIEVLMTTAVNVWLHSRHIVVIITLYFALREVIREILRIKIRRTGCLPCRPYPVATVGYGIPHSQPIPHFVKKTQFWIPANVVHTHLFIVTQDPMTCRCWCTPMQVAVAMPLPMPGMIPVSECMKVNTWRNWPRYFWKLWPGNWPYWLF